MMFIFGQQHRWNVYFFDRNDKQYCLSLLKGLIAFFCLCFLGHLYHSSYRKIRRKHHGRRDDVIPFPPLMQARGTFNDIGASNADYSSWDRDYNTHGGRSWERGRTPHGNRKYKEVEYVKEIDDGRKGFPGEWRKGYPREWKGHFPHSRGMPAIRKSHDMKNSFFVACIRQKE